MDIQRDSVDEARLKILIEEFQEAERRALIKRGIALWTRTERQLGIAPDAWLPPNKIN